MSEKNYAEVLRVLCSDYCNSRISFSEYRERRRTVLDEMDAEFNGWRGEDMTVPKRERSLVKKAADFFGFKEGDGQKGKGDS